MIKKYKIKVLLFVSFYSINLYAQTALDLNKQGEALSKSGKNQQAIRYYDNSITKFNIISARTYHNRGWVCELKGDSKNAIKYYAEAIKRNPRQIHSSERIGLLYFKTKDYEKAILAGERVLQYDAKNKNVKQWLQQAYALRLKQRQEKLKKQNEKDKQKQITDKVKEEREKGRRIVKIWCDFTLRSTYKFDGENDFKYTKTPGYGLDLPNMYYFEVSPAEKYLITGKTGNPYLGALMPDVIHWMEKVDAMFYTGEYFLGLGVLGHHYTGKIFSLEEETLNDYKIGLLLGMTGKQSSLYFSFFPRFIPYDAGYADNRTLDVESFELKYDYRLNERFSVNAGVLINGYYFFDHGIEMSHFFGSNDFILGVAIREKIFTINIDFTERLYYIDIANEEPYQIANGQGYFGVNAKKWFKGDPISGFETYGHILSVGVQEDVHKNVFFYQKIIVEFVPPSQYGHDFCLQLGFGGAY